MSTAMIPAQTQDSRVFSGLPSASCGGYFRFANFHVDLKREELFKDGTRVRLPGKVYQALVTLLEQPGEVVSRDELRKRLWPEGTHVNYDANVNTTVNKLRQALGDSPEEPKFVETIPRQGYSFVAPVERLTSLPHTNGTRPSAAKPKLEKSEAKSSWLPAGGLTPVWVKAAAISLVIAGMLFGAAIVIYARHAL
jgi:DNA-binding winged helix-turn-helix (wHTH) protein